MPILKEVRLKSEEPDAGEPPVRFAGRGAANQCGLPTAINRPPRKNNSNSAHMCRPLRPLRLNSMLTGAYRPRQRVYQPFRLKSALACQWPTLNKVRKSSQVMSLKFQSNCYLSHSPRSATLYALLATFNIVRVSWRPGVSLGCNSAGRSVGRTESAANSWAGILW